MQAPTYEESIAAILRRAKDIAAAILKQRGMVFSEVKDLQDMRRIMDEDVDRFFSENDVEAVAAAAMQCSRFLDQTMAFTEKLCGILCQWADDYFYGDGNTTGALETYQLAAGLNPLFQSAIRGVLSVCLHGDPKRPKVALPYMVVLAKLGGRDETGYVLKLISESELHSSPKAAPEESAAADAIFPVAGGNMQRSGFVATSLMPPLQQAWTFQAGWIKGSPVIGGSTLVFGDKKGVIHGLDWKTGEKRWEQKIQGEVYGTPAIRGDCVFIGDSMHAVCLDLNSGEEVWGTQAGEKKGLEAVFSMMGCVLTFHDRVFYADSRVALYDADTGRLIHQDTSASDPDTHLGGCSDGSYVYFPSGRSLMRLDPSRGSVERTFGEGKIISGPMIADDLIVYGTNRSTIEAHALSNLEHLWTFQAGGEPYLVQCRPAYSDGRIFFGAPDGVFYALDKKTGRVIWKQPLSDSIESSPLVCENVVYVTARGFFALDVADGRILWREEFRKIITSSPAVAGDLIVFGMDRLYAYRGKA